MTAHTTDWAAMGLPEERGQTAFTAVPPRGATIKPCTAPKKRGPKMTTVQKAVSSLMSYEERIAAREARILKDNTGKSITIGKPGDADKTARIKRGRSV